MKHLDPVPLPEYGAKGEAQDQHGTGSDDDFPTCLAEAIDILADRARRHGLVEAAHLLEVAALAARDSAPVPAGAHCRPEDKRDGAPFSPA